jgi:hypothetical protein
MTWNDPTDCPPETLCKCCHPKSLHTERPEGHPGHWYACSFGCDADDSERLCHCARFLPARDPEA